MLNVYNLTMFSAPIPAARNLIFSNLVIPCLFHFFSALIIIEVLAGQWLWITHARTHTHTLKKYSVCKLHFLFCSCLQAHQGWWRWKQPVSYGVDRWTPTSFATQHYCRTVTPRLLHSSTTSSPMVRIFTLTRKSVRTMWVNDLVQLLESSTLDLLLLPTLPSSSDSRLDITWRGLEQPGCTRGCGTVWRLWETSKVKGETKCGQPSQRDWKNLFSWKVALHMLQACSKFWLNVLT